MFNYVEWCNGSDSSSSIRCWMFHSFQNVESSSHGHIWIILDPWTWLYRHIDAMGASVGDCISDLTWRLISYVILNVMAVDELF